MGDNRVEIVDSELEFYEGGEVEETHEIEGITGNVTDYTFTDMSCPCIIFNKGFQTEKHKFQVIQNMVSNIGKNKDISVYFINKSNELLKIGTLSGYQVSSLIDMVGRENLRGYYDDGSELKGSLIYTLCSF